MESFFARRSLAGAVPSVRHLLTAGLLLSLGLPAPEASAQAWSSQGVFGGTQGGGEMFGRSVSLSGRRFAVAANGKRVHVYDQLGGTWTKKAQFTATFAGDAEDITVRLSGDVLVVGNQEIYEWNGTTWELRYTLPPYATDVAVRGDMVVAGYPGEDYVGFGRAIGAVHIYSRAGSTWTHAAKLSPDLEGYQDGMGSRIAFYGDTIVALNSPSPHPSDGSVAYVFKRAGGAWRNETRIPLNKGPTGEWSVALSGTSMLLGNHRLGEVQLFQDRGDGTWYRDWQTGIPGAESGETPYTRFGGPLAYYEGRMAAVADNATATSGVSRFAVVYGAAGQFAPPPERATRTSMSDPAAVALSSRLLLIGNPGADYSQGDVQVLGDYYAPDDDWENHAVGLGSALPSTEQLGTITIRGMGRDIWGAADEFHFRSRPAAGDRTLVVRVTDPGTGDPWAKSGVMFRESLHAGAPNAMALVTAGRRVGLQYRAAAGGGTVFVDGGAANGAVWLMLDREGDTFRAYRSADGRTWTALGSAVVPMAGINHAGLAVTSHKTNYEPITATFDNFMLLDGAGATGGPVGAPTSLRATNLNHQSVSLAWDDNATDESGYLVERAQGAFGESYNLVATLAANVTAYTQTSLSEETTYRYRVRAKRGSENSAYSNVLTVTTPKFVPAAWTDQDFGNGPAGSTSISGGTVTLQAGGADIWGTADAFRFHHRTLKGDGYAIVRIASHTNTHPWSRAGLMIRAALTPNSVNVAMLLTAGNVSSFQVRATTGGATTMTSGPWVHAPYWVMLERHGNVFTGYVSAYGGDWVKVGTTTLELGPEVYFGLAVSSHHPTALTTAVFDDVRFIGESGTLPGTTDSDWTLQKWAGGQGEMQETADGLSLSASGPDQWGVRDGGLFAYQAWTGDGEISLRVDGLTATDDWAKAGVMVRASAADNAANAFVAMLPKNGAIFQTRATAGGTSTQHAQNWMARPGDSLKLVRRGNTFSAYWGVGDSNWYLLGTQTIELPATILIGVAASSHGKPDPVAFSTSRLVVKP